MKRQPVKEIKLGDKVLRIFADESPESPRSWDNMAKFICFHKRYSLGDKHEYRHDDYAGWDEMKQAIIKKEKAVIVKPLYMYDHSGITISTSPFSCPWDSGKIGFVIATAKDVRECFGVKRITKKILERAEKNLDGEVKTYDQYITGDVYGFQIVKVTTCSEGHEHEEEDSCWGFYGNDFANNGIADDLDEEFKEALKAA